MAEVQSEFVEVVDLTFLVNVPGKDGQPATLQYTVRPEAGDVFGMHEGFFVIQFAPRDVRVGLEMKRLPGKNVRLVAAQLVGIERDARMEPRIRPSARLLANRDQAELDVLRKKLEI